MAWFGQIVEFERRDIGWYASVEYYDDSNPDLRIPIAFNWPLSINRAQAVSDIRQKGAEVRSYATINTQGIIGNVIAIP